MERRACGITAAPAGARRRSPASRRLAIPGNLRSTTLTSLSWSRQSKDAARPTGRLSLADACADGACAAPRRFSARRLRGRRLVHAPRAESFQVQGHVREAEGTEAASDRRARCRRRARGPRPRPRRARRRRGAARGTGGSRARAAPARRRPPSRSFSTVIGSPYGMRDARQACCGASQVASPGRARGACTSTLPMPASSSGCAHAGFRRALMPGRWSPRSSRLAPSSSASQPRARRRRAPSPPPVRACRSSSARAGCRRSPARRTRGSLPPRDARRAPTASRRATCSSSGR